MSPVDIKQQIENEARRLGFDYFGVASPGPPPRLPAYLGWIEAGRHGEMGYLAGEQALLRRGDPRRILPECRSIIVLGMRYSPGRDERGPDAASFPAGERGDQRGPLGRIASYAWGDDYHELLVEKLEALGEFIEGATGAAVARRGYTDTGPLLERDLGQQAGLGWAGKNTCLIVPGEGSYFFLAELLVDLALPPDAPFEPDRCGSCTRCLEACPASCILPDRTLDARRCISYLTIELKGPVPRELRPLLGDWVFGCDVCQQVCPWNLRFARPASEPAFAPRPGLPAPALEEELRLTPEAFNRKFKGSPVRRTKRRGYLRNVAIALGNRRRADSVPVLAAALRDPEALVRGHAAWALGCIGGLEAGERLRAALRDEPDAWVRAEIQAALEANGSG